MSKKTNRASAASAHRALSIDGMEYWREQAKQLGVTDETQKGEVATMSKLMAGLIQKAWPELNALASHTTTNERKL